MVTSSGDKLGGLRCSSVRAEAQFKEVRELWLTSVSILFVMMRTSTRWSDVTKVSEQLQRMRGAVHQAQLGLERSDADRRLTSIEIALKCLRLECLFGKVLEVGGLLVGHLLVAAHVVCCFHDASQPVTPLQVQPHRL
jgi:hypothetical protein